jgi:hypothetical protein
MARISAIYIWHMRFILAITILFAAPVFGQSGEWDPTPYNAAGIRFHDDLDFFLTSYTKPEIKGDAQGSEHLAHELQQDDEGHCCRHPHVQ